MFGSKRQQTRLAVLTVLMLVMPCVASMAGGYDRMEGEHIRPKKRSAPEREFGPNPRATLNRYTVRSREDPKARWSQADQNEAAATYSNPQTRPYEPRVTRVGDTPSVVSVRFDEANADAGEDLTGAGNAETVDAAESDAEFVVVQTSNTEGVPREEPVARRPIVTDPDNQLVYCERRLYEFHWDRDCRMLGDVSPTPLTLKTAKAATFVECTACGNR